MKLRGPESIHRGWDYWLNVQDYLRTADTSHDGVPRCGLGFAPPGDSQEWERLKAEAARGYCELGVWDPEGRTGLGPEVFATWAESAFQGGV